MPPAQVDYRLRPGYGSCESFHRCDVPDKINCSTCPKPAGSLTDFESCRFARLDLVENAIIDISKSRCDHAAESIAVFTDHIDAGLQTRLLRIREHPGRLGPELRIREVERVEEQQIAEVE